jgi:hypothetical protein
MDVLPSPPSYPPPRAPEPVHGADAGITETPARAPHEAPLASNGTAFEWFLLLMFALAFVQSRRTRRGRRASPTATSSR